MARCSIGERSMLTNSTRREFLKTAAAGAAIAACPSLLQASPDRLPIGFSTLGCPAWEWLQILDYAVAHGFSAVELRGLQGNMDLPARPEISAERLAQSKRDIASRGLKLACVSSSANLHDADAAKHEQQLADAKRFIDLASSLGSPYVRVFGNKIEGPREPVIERVAAGLRDLGAYAGPKKVT